MKTLISISLISIFITYSSVGFSQENISAKVKPQFERFVGMVYEMPVLERKMGKGKSIGIQEFFSDTIYTYDTLGSISLDKINIPETVIDDAGFPGIDRRTKFAMILKSKMHILKDACYEFDLKSDDGSRLWINGEQLIDNDGGHAMRSKKDSIRLLPGKYDLRLWYFQGLPDKLGFIFDAIPLDSLSYCDETMDELVKIDSKLVFKGVFFDHDQYDITPAGIEVIKEFVTILNQREIKKIRVEGHTDKVGTKAYNMDLSKNRAESVLAELRKLIADKNIVFESIGKSDSEPIDLSGSSEARAKNRRVEIIIED